MPADLKMFETTEIMTLVVMILREEDRFS